jgi:hypothetical protein
VTAPPPAQAAARCAADISPYADSRLRDLFPPIKGKLQVCDRGGERSRVHVLGALFHRSQCPSQPPIVSCRRRSVLGHRQPRLHHRSGSRITVRSLAAPPSAVPGGPCAPCDELGQT